MKPLRLCPTSGGSCPRRTGASRFRQPCAPPRAPRPSIVSPRASPRASQRAASQRCRGSRVDPWTGWVAHRTPSRPVECHVTETTLPSSPTIGLTRQCGYCRSAPGRWTRRGVGYHETGLVRDLDVHQRAPCPGTGSDLPRPPRRQLCRLTQPEKRRASPPADRRIERDL